MSAVRTAAVRTDTTETLWERRRRLVSRDIENVALGEFASHGYENVTIDQIARAAGITVRSFYRYFSSKEDVLLAMPRRVTARMCEAVGARPRNESVIESYRHAIAERADAADDDEQIALQWQEIFQQSSNLPWMVTHPTVIDTVVAVIAERMELDAEDDPRPRVIAAAICGALDVALARWLATGGTGDRQRLMIEALDILESISTPSALSRRTA